MNPNHHTFTVRTARRHGHRGSSGYTVSISPPLVTFSQGEDVEGLGWVPHYDAPRKRSHPNMGWFRYRADAEQSAVRWRAGHGGLGCSCLRCDPSHQGHAPRIGHAEKAVAALCGH